MEEVDGLSVSEVAERLQIEKSIASRLLASLAEAGYVERNPRTDLYRLSLRLLALASRFADTRKFPEFCLPLLEPFARHTGELVQLAAVGGDRLYFVARVEGTQRIQVRSVLGRDIPLHASSSGKAWLASLPEERAVAIALAQGLTPLTPRSITSIDALLAELRAVRRQGYATVDEEFAEGAGGVGAPIGQARFGHVVGAVVLSAPTSRYPVERLHSLADPLKALAADLEAVWPLDAWAVKPLVSPFHTAPAPEAAL